MRTSASGESALLLLDVVQSSVKNRLTTQSSGPWTSGRSARNVAQGRSRRHALGGGRGYREASVSTDRATEPAEVRAASNSCNLPSRRATRRRGRAAVQRASCKATGRGCSVSLGSLSRSRRTSRACSKPAWAPLTGSVRAVRKVLQNGLNAFLNARFSPDSM